MVNTVNNVFIEGKATELWMLIEPDEPVRQDLIWFKILMLKIILLFDVP